MLEKNYTNPEDRGRFGFSASGKFCSPLKSEHVIVAVIIAAAVVAEVLFVLFMLRLMRSNITGMEGGIMLEALFIGVGCVVVALIIFLMARVLIKMIMGGIRCTYIADEERFCATIGGTMHTIYYKDVQNVHFLPITTFRGAVRGYTVTVKLNGTYEEFKVVSDSYISEQTTPFYIIKERMEIIRAAENRERARAEDRALTLNESVSPVKKDEKEETMSRLSSILGKDAEMPGVRAPAEIEKTAPLPDIASRVSPTVNGYADDMPAVGKNGKTISPVREYIGSDGRTQSENDIIARGTFRTPVSTRTAVIVGVIAIIVYLLLFGLVLNWTLNINELAYIVGMVIMVLLAPFIAGTIINYLRNGKEYTYKANGREFVVTSKNSEERFLYKDVQSVTYKKVEFLWFIKGYKVEILTKFGITKYEYVCPGFGRLIPEKDLPFEVIKEHIEKK